MRLLLDTHTYLWLRTTPLRLSPSVAHAIASGENELFLSIVSLWEMAIKAGQKQLVLPVDGIAAVAAELPLFSITLLPIALDDVVALEELPLLHRDPFDRLLIAQAMANTLVLVTDDGLIQKYNVATMWE